MTRTAQARSAPLLGEAAASVGLESSRNSGSPSSASLRHRNDIDGLRAVAVLPVIAFHYGMVRVASGGYVGVDVFFVISGFLITGILVGNAQRGLAGTVVFYSRRIRRIFPALIAVYLACAGASLLLDFPSEMWTAIHALLASLTFWSNIYFAGLSGYFDLDSASNPLLHTWSLSVEEQFYIFFPPLLFLIRRFAPNRLKLIIAAVFVASLAASIWAEVTRPVAAFYFVQYRAWELMTGSLLAVGAVPRVHARWLAEALGLAGLLMIAVAAHFYVATTPFPGATALLPCVGAALVIHAGAAADTWTRRALALAPLRFIGLISYSLYLWHWPVWVFGGMIREPYVLRDKLVLVAISVVLAWLSWRFVEQPFRNPARRFTDPQVIGFGLAGMAATAAIAVTLALVSPRIWNISPQATAMLAYLKDNSTTAVTDRGCFLTGEAASFQRFNRTACLNIDPDRTNVLVVGDSHAAHLVSGIEHANPAWNMLVATSIGCKPVIGTTGAPGCVRLDDFIFDDFVRQHRLNAIILSGRWTMADVGAVAKTVIALKRYADRIIVSGPIVEYDEPLPRILALSVGKDEEALAARHRRAEPAAVDKALSSAVAEAGGDYSSVIGALCTPTCTLWAKPGVPLQFDYGHLTTAGSDYLAAHRPELHASQKP